MSLIFHPLLALIASVTDRELAKYVELLKEENKILRSRVSGQIHTKPYERDRLLKLGKPFEEFLTIVSSSTFYRLLRDASQKKKRKTSVTGGRAKPKEIRDLVIQIEKSTRSFRRITTPIVPTRNRTICRRWRMCQRKS